MQDLRITLVQTPLYWEEPAANMAMLEEKLVGLRGATDLILLPEMFTTGFTMNTAAVAEPMNLHATRWMKQMAAQTQAVVVGSVVIKEAERVFNRLIWMRPDGSYATYDKKHLFRMAGEHEVYSAGEKQLVVECKGWKIMPLICYDLRFPVWSRNVDLQYDLLLYVANWPAPRAHAWKSLLPARAIENISYVAAVNRVGTDAKGLSYAGDSAVYDMKGELLQTLLGEEQVHTVALSAEALQAFRKKFPADRDADRFHLL